MNTILKQQYDDARRIALEEAAYMLNQIEQFAEENGGIETLNEDQRRIYNGRRRRILRLTAVHDRAQEYIEDLEDWIGSLIQENRRLATEVADQNHGWLKYFPRMASTNESAREHQRFIKLTEAQMTWADHF